MTYRVDVTDEERQRELRDNRRVVLDSILAIRLEPAEAEEVLARGYYDVDLDNL